MRQIKECFSQFRNLYRTLESELEDRIKQKGGYERGDEKSGEYSSKDASSAKGGANAALLESGDDNAVGDLEGTGFGVGLVSCSFIMGTLFIKFE